MDLDLLIYGYTISGTDQKKLVTVAASGGEWAAGLGTGAEGRTFHCVPF